MPDKSSRLLVFTTCYNEFGNIGGLIDKIIELLPQADVLVVDDNSPDGTFEVVLEKSKVFPQVTGVQRPRKLGIGSAHKYALLYAMREGYDTLITMDADWSHDPKYFASMLQALEENTFVTGSRYCEGGSCDYTGYRNIVSRFGNIVARYALSVKIKELSTYLRAFDVQNLRQLPLRHVKGAGYSYGVQLIYYLRKAGVELREIPIHFADRTHGASKIPRLQILHSAIDLLILMSRRLNYFRDLAPDTFVGDECPNCHDRVLAMKHLGSGSREEAHRTSPLAYHCTSVGSRSYPPVYTCLRCGLQQVPGSMLPHNLENLYKDVVDEEYLNNLEARRRTFRRAFDQLAISLPPRPGRMLEVGAYCGLFMQEASSRGWEIDGVEPSTWAARYARESLGVNVYSGFLADNRSKLHRKYDVVASWDVLEHVRDPLTFVRECAEYLDVGGIFCFSTLDVDTWFPQLSGTRWPWLIDMHLHYFDRHVIEDLLARAGFELLRVEPYAHYAHLRYALRGAARIFPSRWERVFESLTKIVPSKLVLPVKFGDIKLYVARKSGVTVPSEKLPEQAIGGIHFSERVLSK